MYFDNAGLIFFRSDSMYVEQIFIFVCNSLLLYVREMVVALIIVF